MEGSKGSGRALAASDEVTSELCWAGLDSAAHAGPGDPDKPPPRQWLSGVRQGVEHVCSWCGLRLQPGKHRKNRGGEQSGELAPLPQ